jgi:hypothetical protein
MKEQIKIINKVLNKLIPTINPKISNVNFEMNLSSKHKFNIDVYFDESIVIDYRDIKDARDLCYKLINVISPNEEITSVKNEYYFTFHYFGDVLIGATYWEI